MKPVLKSGLVIMVISFMLSGCAGSNALSQNNVAVGVTYQTFYDHLSPYGTWIDYPGYGHVWNPQLAGDFRPYASNGHWLFSEEGWTWASDYSWGWAPFHYGRWLYDDMYGWLWIPGYDWSPAWVTWGTVDDFYCWAPLMPGIDVGLQFGSWRPHSFYWNACRRDHIYDRHLAVAIERPAQITSIVNRIKIINNFTTTRAHNLYYSKGPDVHEVEKYVNRHISQASIKNVDRIPRVKNNGKTMRVYRPSVQDPGETVQRHRQNIAQPREFRKVETEQSKPIRTEEQKPVLQRSEQRANIERLPLHRNAEVPHGNSGGRGRGRN
jgi:hypothetical protein